MDRGRLAGVTWLSKSAGDDVTAVLVTGADRGTGADGGRLVGVASRAGFGCNAICECTSSASGMSSIYQFVWYRL